MISICLSCGCNKPDKRHGDSRNITLTDIQSAAKAAKTDTHHVMANMMEGYDKMKPGEVVTKDLGISLIKSQEEQRYTLGVAYAANMPDVGKAADGYRDFAGPEALEKAAWSYMQKGGNVGLHHQSGTDGQGTVVESYIYRGPDWSVSAIDGSTQVIKEGDWLVGILWNDEAWDLVKSGVVTGYSPQGTAKRRTPNKETLAQLRSR